MNDDTTARVDDGTHPAPQRVVTSGSHRTVHVVLATPGFPDDNGDSTCIPPLQQTLQALTIRHPELRITVMAINYPYRRTPYQWHGIRIVPLDGRNRPWPLRLAAIRRGLAESRRIHEEHGVDLIHGLWLGDAALLGLMAARRLGIPMAATALGQDVKPSNRYLKLLPLRSMNLSAVSERAASDLEASTGIEVNSILPWGLDTATGELPSWSDRELDLLGVGSLTANKNFVSFVRIVDRLRSEGRSVRAAIIGDGPERPALRCEIERRGLSDVVELRGMLPRTRVLEAMRGARVLLHPSRFESFGYVFLEALAHGMAVVSRPTGIAEETASWQPCSDDAEMTAACGSFLDRELLERTAPPFPLGASVRAWAALYGLEHDR